MATADQTDLSRPSLSDRIYGWRTALLRSRKFQKWAARTPFAARIAKKDGEALFDLVAGFIHAQVLQAFVILKLSDHLAHAPRSVQDLALRTQVPASRMRVLCQAATSLGLMKRTRNGRYALGRLGAALPGIPGLEMMIAHHDVLYRDLMDPVVFFRDGSTTELADFWPYVFGATGEIDTETAETYSDLMAESQTLVAEEALRHLDLRNVETLLDVGGGTGAFLTAVGLAYPEIRLQLFDLPVVAQGARARFERHGLSERATISGGSFRTDALPSGADAISLVRVLYDHSDETVEALLKKVFAALPDGGRVIVAEPMSGGDHPERAGDAYFAIYCMAMRTGRARSAAEISELLEKEGFSDIRAPRIGRMFITGLVTATKPARKPV
ncbi:Hydroxyneurosporene methyltransferase [Roseibacterium elongatum DSM 19469]|uniref:Hydroxyneurosporene methyltransferase n=1 Tax=Roseicyclus elongatus DSM 19469 TaxID=1294273 RepID=W8RQZ1_9RHOB|nr:methyltransferase [Roseibacterium elongatum]AHM03473.1 Hydroxyneurosporene methyltransferase [Roseibacterium elongatum DSM 19469]